jgi:hypothetical protein
VLDGPVALSEQQNPKNARDGESGLGGILAAFLLIDENHVSFEFDSQCDRFGFSWVKVKQQHAQ